MKTYIYPENLRATVKLWFWNVRDFIIICGGIIVSVMLFAKLWTPVPMAMTACYAFLTLRAEDTTIMNYILYNRIVSPMEKKIMQQAMRKNTMISTTNDINETVKAEENMSDIVNLLAELKRDRESLLHTGVFIPLIQGNIRLKGIPSAHGSFYRAEG